MMLGKKVGKCTSSLLLGSGAEHGPAAAPIGLVGCLTKALCCESSSVLPHISRECARISP